MGFGSPAEVDLEESVLMSLKDRDQWRDQISNQKLIGPYISASAVYQIEEYGDIWNNEELMPPQEEILRVFSRLKQDGVDFIKITLENNPPKEFFYRTMIDSYDPQLAEHTFQSFKNNNSWYCPTHITRRWEAHYDDDAYRDDERVKYVPYLLRSIWSLDAFIMSKKAPSEILKDHHELGLTITKQAHQSGVGLLAGSDMLDAYAFYGSGLWDELSEFDKAGIPTKDILRIATIDSATFSNQQESFGSVEAGKVADLLLLRKDPLENIKNLDSLETVIVHQQIFDQNDIATLKDYVVNPSYTGGVTF